MYKRQGLRLLTTLEEKTALLAASGVDALVVIPFDRSFSTLSGAEFLDRYLIGKIGAETLVVGYNHRFGHDRADCRKLAEERGLWPVSYTHLDVYKRQLSRRAGAQRRTPRDHARRGYPDRGHQQDLSLIHI